MNTLQARDDLQRRIGRFFVDRNLMDHAPELVARILAGKIIVRAQLVWERDAFEYVALAPDFAPAMLGEAPPEYRLMIDPKTQGISFARAQTQRRAAA